MARSSFPNLRQQVVVIGGGAVGLSTALCIQERFRNRSSDPNGSPLNFSVDVTLIADAFTKDTTSYGAAGFFRLDADIGHSLDTLRKWGKDGYDHFLALMRSKDADKIGIQWVSGYHLTSIDRKTVDSVVSEELLPGYRILTPKELELFPPEVKYGTTYSTFVIDCRRYLPWMMEQFERNGGRILRRTVKNLKELEGTYDIVVNCAGLRAEDLVDDIHVVPVRGQVLKVKAPWVKHFYVYDSAYIFPGVDYVTMGGCRDFACYDKKPSPQITQEIWKKCTDLIPSLEHSELETEWVGLRPFRPSIRVEKEHLQLPGSASPLKVVHNYGHGGNGITLSWGTAVQAAKLVEEMLQEADSVPAASPHSRL